MKTFLLCHVATDADCMQCSWLIFAFFTQNVIIKFAKMYIYDCFIVFYNIWLNRVWTQEDHKEDLINEMLHFI